jgi:hypothetical protein
MFNQGPAPTKTNLDLGAISTDTETSPALEPARLAPALPAPLTD